MNKVNHPDHYNAGKIETIELIKDMGIAEEFCVGNAIKYITRYRHKDNPVEDLQKARWYIDYTIKILKARENEHTT